MSILDGLTLGQQFFFLFWAILAISAVPFAVIEYMGWSKRENDIEKLQWRGKK